MPCGKRSTSPRGPDLAKDQRRPEFYHPMRGTILFVLFFVIYFRSIFLFYVYWMLLMKYFGDNKSSLKSIYILQFVKPTLGTKESHACLGRDICVFKCLCVMLQ